MSDSEDEDRNSNNIFMSDEENTQTSQNLNIEWGLQLLKKQRKLWAECENVEEI